MTLFELKEDKIDDEVTVTLTGGDAWVIAQQLLIQLDDELSEHIDIAYNAIMIALIDGDFLKEYIDED